MLLYFLQIIFVQFVFLLMYELFFKRETFFKLNRFYLLFSLLLSLLIPIIKFSLFYNNNIIYSKLSPIIVGAKNTQNNLTSSFNFNWIYWIYLIGFFISILLLINKLSNIFRLFKTNDKQRINNFVIIELDNISNAFTFFNWIFIDKKIKNKEREKIIKHELVHIEKKHYLDLLFIEILRIAFWFNPLLSVFRKHLILIHEYEADKEVIKIYNSKEYFNFLLQHKFRVKNVSFINQFNNYELIKKRIIMQKKSKSSKSAIVKYAYFIFTAVGLNILLNACNHKININSKKEKYSIVKNNINNKTSTVYLKRKKDNNYIKISKNDSQDKTIGFLIIENPPIYSGCEGLSNRDAKKCMNKKIKKFITENFNINLAKKLKNKDDTIKILSQFVIDKQGKISKIVVRSKYKSLEKEAKRVISLLPVFKPGKYNEKFVKVVYNLPIVLKIK